MLQNKYKVKPVIQKTDKQQQEVVYFRVRRPATYIPQQQFIINREPTKHHSKLSTQAQPSSTKVETTKPIPQRQQNADVLVNLLSGMSIKNPVQYFLKRVESLTNNNNPVSKLYEKSSQLSNANRQQNRQMRLDKARGISHPIKIVDIQANTVQLGGQKLAVQNLGDMNDYYYILGKRNIIKQGITVQIPETEKHLLDQLVFQQQMQQQNSEGSLDDQDSNRESNPDYDYPEQDHHQGGSDDQGVIHKDYYPGKSDDEDNGSEQAVLDQQELYRNYLKRCRKERNKQDSDDQYF